MRRRGRAEYREYIYVSCQARYEGHRVSVETSVSDLQWHTRTWLKRAQVDVGFRVMESWRLGGWPPRPRLVDPGETGIVRGQQPNRPEPRELAVLTDHLAGFGPLAETMHDCFLLGGTGRKTRPLEVLSAKAKKKETEHEKKTKP